MENLAHNKQVNFKTNADLLEQAKEVFKRKHIDVSTAMNTVLQTVVETQDFPFVTEEERVRQEIIDYLEPRMREAKKNYDEGKGIPIDEVFAKYGL